MYSITVRDHIMVAHTLRGDVFGPAQKLHGATYVVDVELRRSTLDASGIVLDLGRAATALRDVLGGLNYRNLDDDPSLATQNTTTEVLARVIFDRLVAAISRGDLGPGGSAIESIRVTLHESHIAAASFDSRV
jgi:6-pyruvoyl-tetrahydropterin synthase